MYEGNWRKSVKHGKGRYNYASGDVYTGDWYRGKRHGVGIYTFRPHTQCIPIPVRFKGTWRHGIRVGPFEVYFGNEDKCTILHGTWDNEYPQGPAIFSFDQKNMLMGFFQTPRTGETIGISKSKQFPEETEFINEEGGEQGDDVGDILPSIWFAQDICAYDYAQLPQEPVPLPLSDSDISVCSLSTVPTEGAMEKEIEYPGEGEGEEGEGECVPCDFECSMSEVDTESEIPCADPKADPCAIEILSKPKC